MERQSTTRSVNGKDLFKQEIIQSIDQVSAHEWNRCVPSDCPFLRHEFLNAMEQSGCVSEETGWRPMHIVLRISDCQDSRLAGALPLYRKYHSWGEFIFDWQWENAYFRHGVQYYPKLVSVSPFTGLPAPKLLTAPDAPTDEVRNLLTESCLSEASHSDLSSLHLLFLNPDELDFFAGKGLIPRRSNISFVWTNNDYRSMDEFLSTLSSRKRKKIKYERKSIREQGLQVKAIPGYRYPGSSLAFLPLCYYSTTRKYDSFRYLNRHFFQMIRESMPENLLLILAEHDDRPVASGLFYQGWWKTIWTLLGCIGIVPNLHFEICYYSAIEYCIENGFRQCHAGVQGTHKLSRDLCRKCAIPHTCSIICCFRKQYATTPLRNRTVLMIVRNISVTFLHMPKVRRPGIDHLSVGKFA